MCFLLLMCWGEIQNYKVSKVFQKQNIKRIGLIN